MSSTRTAIKKITLHVLVAVLAVLGAASAQSAPQRVAVLDFNDNSTGSVTPQEILYLSDLVRGSARSTLPAARFVLMTRENILELLPEGRTLADCMGDCAVETGRKIGADYVATGEVTIFAGEIRVTVNLHETGSGNLLGQARAGGLNLLDVEKDLGRKALDLLTPLRGDRSVAGVAAQEERAIGGGAKAWSATGGSEEVVTFSSDPVGAMVELDGQPIGETPCKRALAPGIYQVGIKKLRYVAHTQALEVVANRSSAVSVALTPDFGWITIESDPAGLAVSIDDNNVGSTPIMAKEIETGPHDVVVGAESYHAEGRHVVVDRGEREIVKVAPVPRNGGLKVIATDRLGNAAEARVRIDDADAGRTYQPITLLRGSHRVLVDGAAGSWAGDVVIDESVLLEFPVSLPGLEVDAAQATAGAIAEPRSARMVRVPEGKFMMGSPPSDLEHSSDEIRHSVRISKPFMLMTTELTQAQYESVMGENPSQVTGPDLPVGNVSWMDAVQYCNRLSEREGLSPAYRIGFRNVTWNRDSNGYRLPTECEWEYACRARAATNYSQGASEAALDSVGWYEANAAATGAQPVGGKAPNAWGLYDMHGNVWEWCWDRYGEYKSGVETDPQGPSNGEFRVVRGGSWDYAADFCRSAKRVQFMSGYAYPNVGFRVARNVE
jgi:formylglycine-generating enzyme required for sulfatase activity